MNAEPTISILTDDPRLGLFVGCGFIVVFLIIAAVGIIVRTRYQTAHYYTHEAERPEIQTPPVPPPEGNETNGGFDNLYYNGNYKDSKWNKMIATIDEIHYVESPYPELEGSLHITDTTNIMLPPPSSYR